MGDAFVRPVAPGAACPWESSLDTPGPPAFSLCRTRPQTPHLLSLSFSPLFFFFPALRGGFGGIFFHPPPRGGHYLPGMPGGRGREPCYGEQNVFMEMALPACLPPAVQDSISLVPAQLLLNHPSFFYPVPIVTDRVASSNFSSFQFSKQPLSFRLGLARGRNWERDPTLEAFVSFLNF